MNSTTTAEIHIVNTSAKWFLLCEYLTSKGLEHILNCFDFAESNSEEFFRAVKGKQSAGKVLVSSTDWRKTFGMELLNLYWVPEDHVKGFVNYSKKVELTLWYADKFGDGVPNFLSLSGSEGFGTVCGGK